MRRRPAIFLASIVLLSGCHLLGPRGGDHGPKLVSCIEARQMGNGKRSYERVALSYVVNRFGGVDAESIRLVTYTGTGISRDAAISDASTTAASCTYEPAIRGGYAVDEKVQRTFVVEVPDVGFTRIP